jgi:hypothetical protein
MAAPRTIYVALAAKTPLYLPFYVAKYRSFYNLIPADFRVEPYLRPSDHTGDADQWVHDEVARNDGKKDVLFGICDPYKDLGDSATKLVGVLVDRLAFWLVTKGWRCSSLDELPDHCDHLVSYPKGMTGYTVWQLTVARGKQANPAWVVEESHPEIGSELNELFPADRTRYAAITSDLMEALTHGKKLCVAYSFAENPQWSQYVTTGLIAWSEIDKEKGFGAKGKKLAAALASSLQLALIDIRRNPEWLKNALLEGLGRKATTETMQIAEDTIQRMRRDDIFPDNLKVRLASWANAIVDRRKLEGRSVTESAVKQMIDQEVEKGWAEDAYRENVINRLRPAMKGRYWRASLDLLARLAYVYFIIRSPWNGTDGWFFLGAAYLILLWIWLAVFDDDQYPTSKWTRRIVSAFGFLILTGGFATFTFPPDLVKKHVAFWSHPDEALALPITSMILVCCVSFPGRLLRPIWDHWFS